MLIPFTYPLHALFSSKKVKKEVHPSSQYIHEHNALNKGDVTDVKYIVLLTFILHLFAIHLTPLCTPSIN